MPREEEGEAIKETEAGQVEAVVEASKDTEAGLELLWAEGWGAGKVVGLLVEWTTLNRS